MSVLVVTEQHSGGWHRMSFEVLAAGQEASRAMDSPLVAAVVGSGIGGLAAEIAGTDLSQVVALDHPALASYSPDGYAEALRQAIAQLQPELVLFPHTYQVRDLAPKLAASLDRALVSDTVGIRFQDGKPIFVRQLFQGKLHADVLVEGDAPHFASVQSGAYRADAVATTETSATVRRLAVELDASVIRTQAETPTKRQRMPWTSARPRSSCRSAGAYKIPPHPPGRAARHGARRRTGCVEADLRQRVAASGPADRQFGPDGLPESLSSTGNLRRHPARSGDEGLQDDCGCQQGRGSSNLRNRGLRHRRRFVRYRSSPDPSPRGGRVRFFPSDSSDLAVASARRTVGRWARNGPYPTFGTRRNIGCRIDSLLSPPGATREADDRPNFVLVFIDDMGYGDIGAFGSTDHRTPHIDAMAEEGMKLTSFYAHPVCTPSRAALLTGCYPIRNGLQTGFWHPVLMPGDPVGIHPGRDHRSRGPAGTGLRDRYGRQVASGRPARVSPHEPRLRLLLRASLLQ